MMGIGRKFKSVFGFGKGCKPILKRRDPLSIYLGDFQALTKLYDGTIIFVDTRDSSVTPHLLLSGEWEMDVTFHWNRIIDEIKPKCVFDVGANTGYFGLLAARRDKKVAVHFFEANPRLSSLLRRSTTLNGFSGRTSVVNNGVTDRSGDELKLTIPAGYLGSASFHHDLVKKFSSIEFVEKDKIESVSVGTITLDDYVNEKKIVPDLIKVDVEGFEECVMHGATSVFSSDAPQVVFLEYTPGAYSQKFIPLLTTLFKRFYVIEGFKARELRNLAEIETRQDWSMLILRK